MLLLLPIILLKTGFFLVNKPVLSSKLLIEGWINNNMLENPPFNYEDYDTIFISGLRRPTDWKKLLSLKDHYNYYENKQSYYLPSNGFIFLRNFENRNFEKEITQIGVIVKGTSANGIFAHFYLSVGDSVMGQSFTGPEYDTIWFNVNINKSKVGYLNVFFDNDLLTQTEDINLIISGILVNNQLFLTSEGDITYIPSHYKNEVYKLFNSNSQEVKEYLITYKKLKSTIIAIDTIFIGRNKTMAEAKSFANYLSIHKIKLKSLNIYSQDFHTRRTKLAYDKELAPLTRVGIIANICTDCIPSTKFELLFSYYQACDEFLSWFITLFS